MEQVGLLCEGAGLGLATIDKCVRSGAADPTTLAEAGRENEEVVPVNVSTWVLLFGVTVGR